ncbi:NAD(P)/FAD-dependent oxidoreductase [Thalassospira tepidiphila]|uniref:NAD(P)/FAD-dependent oxidoreductase n=1 Tax=Thalassospira tepidiphila TaxID=393657 RepID=UPI00291CB7B2|nr:oxidoreductase [Thalassospira tepidiphila]
MLKRIYQPAAYRTDTLPDSYWVESASPLPACETLPEEGHLKTDIAIIGGGYCGLSTALELAKNGASVAVFDAGRSGWGASGRNGGFCCMGGSGKGFGQLAKSFGEDAVKQFARHQRDAIDLVDQRLNDWDIDADRHSDGEVVLAHKPNRVAELAHEAQELSHFTTIPTELLSRDALKERGLCAAETYGGLHVQAGFGINPMKYLSGLHEQCVRAGVRIFEQATIERFEEDGDIYRLYAGNTQITAAKIVIATNGYSAENLPDWIGGRLMPVFSGILITRPLRPDEMENQGWTSDLMAFDSRILLHYFRKLPDNRFLFGGRGGITATPKAFAAGKQDLLDNFKRMFPAWQDVAFTHHWNGLACLSQSWRPYIGRVPGHHDVWTALAWHGNGVAMASLGGKLLAERMLGICDEEDLGAVLTTPMDKFPMASLRRVARSIGYRYYGLHDRFA